MLKIRLLRLTAAFLTILAANLTAAAQELVVLKEITEDGRYVNLQSGASPNTNWYGVDINSIIDVRFNPGTFAINDEGVLLSSESQKLRKQLKELKLLLEQINNGFGRLITDIESVRTAAIANPEAESLFRKKIREHGALVDTLISTLEPIVGKEALENALSTSDPHYTGLVRMLSARIDEIMSRLFAETTQLLQNDAFALKVWCIQNTKDGAKMVHLPNYDLLPSSNFQVVDKLAFARTEKEEAHLRESLKLNKEILALIKEISDKNSDLSLIVSEIDDKFFQDVKELSTLFGADELEAYLNSIEASLNAAASSPEINALKGNVRILKANFDKFFRLQKEYKRLFDNIKKLEGNDPVALFNLIDNFNNQNRQEIQRLISDSKTVFTATNLKLIDDALVQFSASIDHVKTGLAEEVKGRLKNFSNSKYQEWKKEVSDINAVLSKYEAINSFQEELRNAISNKVLAEGLGRQRPNVLQAPEEALTVGLNNAPATTIQVSEREENDSYTLYVQVSRDSKVVALREYTFQVKKYGLYRNWIGGLSFVMEHGTDKFVPSTSASYVLHYKHRPRIKKNGEVQGERGIMGNILDRGFGINSMVIPKDNQVQLGLGGTVTLFRDIIHGGAGINFGSNKAYGFLGASLLEIFKVINP